MSRFYGDLQGSRGSATRQGTAKSGITGHIRGWDTGAQVVVSVDAETGKDRVTVYRTGGSSGSIRFEPVASWVEEQETIHHLKEKLQCER